jgi:hypothetical protein
MPFTQFDHHFQTPRLWASKAAAYKRSVMQLSGARTVPKNRMKGENRWEDDAQCWT